MYDFEEIRKTDGEIADAIRAEMDRQNSHIELIASENWVSQAVMAAMGSPLTNKYAEGYPGKRYYGGCQCVDVVEDIARERAKKLFGCEICQRAAPFRSPGEYGGHVRHVRTGRQDHGNEPGSRRTPDPRLSGEPVRKIF